MVSGERLDELFVKAIEFAITHKNQEITPKDIQATDDEFEELMESLDYTEEILAEVGLG